MHQLSLGCGDGTKTDIIISKYTDSFLVMATQIGSMVPVLGFPFHINFMLKLVVTGLSIPIKAHTELRDSFRFKSYLLISRIYERDPNKPKGKRSVNQDEPVIYIKAEMKYFMSSARGLLLFLCMRAVGSDNLKNYRQMGQVLVVKADDVPKFREKLKSLVAAES
ncbi:Protein BCCIP [Ananas comosus]|uniref:Protein BCCIP n=1 Tax=Ananas comosus TaxID=4615 RepID=A0A199VSN7_ANACO|nr:Protein BCCIP [Ananas comosus]